MCRCIPRHQNPNCHHSSLGRNTAQWRTGKLLNEPPISTRNITQLRERLFMLAQRPQRQKAGAICKDGVQGCASKIDSRTPSCTQLACGWIEIHTGQARRLTEHGSQRRRRIRIESLSGDALARRFHIQRKFRNAGAALLAPTGLHSVLARSLVVD